MRYSMDNTLKSLSSTAFLRTSSATSSASLTTAVPFSWLTLAPFTPSRDSSDPFTEASQCLHIIPSILIVFFIPGSSLSSSSISFIICGISIRFLFLSCLVFLISNRFSVSAFVTTQKLDRLIAAAPNIGLSCHPRRCIHTPAASGIPITLYMNAQNRF